MSDFDKKMRLREKAEEWIKTRGDWDWLNDVVTGEKITAKEALEYGKK